MNSRNLVHRPRCKNQEKVKEQGLDPSSSILWKFFFSICMLFTTIQIQAQEHDHIAKEAQGVHQEAHEEHAEEDGGHEQTHEFKHNAVAMAIGHTLIGSAINDGEKTFRILPSFGINYSYFFTPKWGLGLHSEMIVEDFVVADRSGDGSDPHSALAKQASGGSSEVTDAVIERGRPIAVAIVGIYRVHKHITVFGGGGMEFSSHDDFALVKIGADFPFHLGNNWEFFGYTTFDFKINAYDSFSFGLGVAKLF